MGASSTSTKLSPRCCTIRRDELIGASFRRFTHPEDVDQSQRWLDQVVSGERESVTAVKRYVTAHGDVVEVILSTAAVRGDDGEVVHLFSQIVDITERRAIEVLLERRGSRFPYCVRAGARWQSPRLARRSLLAREPGVV